MKRRVVIIEYEDTPICGDHDIDEALDHLREAHGAKVLEEQVGGLFEKAAAAAEKLRQIADLVKGEGRHG